MGNALRSLWNECCKPRPSSPPPPPPPQHDHPLGPHGITPASVGVSALAHDLFNFEISSQVPDGLSQHVVSSRKAQANWYRKLSVAWKDARPPPRTADDAARLVILTLKGHKKQDVEGLLAFYGLPLPHTLVEAAGVPPSWPEGVKFQLHTLPVGPKDVSDGDTINVYVNTAEPRESASVPREVLEAAIERANARAVKNYGRADALHKSIQDAGYRVIDGPNNDGILTRKYRIRLRGIDAPESAMPYGKEAKEALAELVQGKHLTVLAYGEDRYGRCVGDIYCNGIFVQWEREAQSARIGLWASRNPEKPWEWRRDRRNGA
ncbi:hypothetical protein Taro_039568 [Colocasia esculenta]|uniref:TNase-like domain-containing protein n=1 Tax=Colocasia esculenta TaxID=4460 RepID=A0A843WRX0_COLES|nr:hypothetical protein [Colocasia esculenta]